MTDLFQNRHIGTDDAAQRAMLAVVGYDSVEALVTAAVPPAIHVQQSATRREELLYHPDEWERVQVLRKKMAALPPIDHETIDAYHTFEFSYLNMPFRAVINGIPFSDTQVPAIHPVGGTTEEWKLVNTTGDDHPFHIHINAFQVMSINGNALLGLPTAA